MTRNRAANLVGASVGVLVGLTLLTAIGGGVFLAARWIGVRFADLDRTVANVTAVGGCVILSAAWLIAHRIGAAGRQARAAVVRDEKSATYRFAVNFWIDRLKHGVHDKGAQASAEFDDTLQTLERLLAMYGNAAVIAAHTRLREREAHDGDGRAAVGDLLVAVRKDLGTETPRNMAPLLERLLLPPADGAVRLRAVQA